MKKLFKNWLFKNRNLENYNIFVLIIFVFLASSIKGYSQNLVPNPSFEEYSGCPCLQDQNGQIQDNSISNCIPWRGTNSSTDYYNSCANTQCPTPGLGVPSFYGENPRSGVAMARICMMTVGIPNVREYLQITLLDTLTNQKSYLVSFFTQLDQYNGYAINNIGIYLSNESFSTSDLNINSNSDSMLAPFTPQIVSFSNPVILNSVNNWVEVRGIFRSNGSETTLTIGNFQNDLNTDTIHFSNESSWSCYFFDDVSVEEITQPFWQYQDTTIYYGDSVLIGPALTGLDIDWYTYNLDFISNAPGIYVTPPTSRDYIAKETFNGVETEHVVHVTVIGGAGLEENELQNARVFPNPSKGSFSISGIASDKPLQLEVRDVHGKLVFETSDLSKELNSFELNLENGVYLVTVAGGLKGRRMVEKLVVVNE